MIAASDTASKPAVGSEDGDEKIGADDAETPASVKKEKHGKNRFERMRRRVAIFANADVLSSSASHLFGTPRRTRWSSQSQDFTKKGKKLQRKWYMTTLSLVFGSG